MELDSMRLGELRSSNPLRIPHPKIDKLACQAQGVGILAVGEISLLDAYCTYLISGGRYVGNDTAPQNTRGIDYITLQTKLQVLFLKIFNLCDFYFDFLKTY